MFRHIIIQQAVAILFVIAASSCKRKNTTDEVEVNTAEKVRAIVYSNGYTQEYAYDDKGRLTHIKMQDVARFKFSYQNNKATEVHYSDLGIATDTIYYILNSKGLVISEQVPSNPSFSTTHEYNNAGQMTKYHRSNGSSTSDYNFYYNAGGNMDSMRVLINNAWFTSEIYDEFYTGEAATIEYPNMGYTFFGKGNTNPIKRKSERFNSGYSKVTNYTYEYDANGRITQSTAITDAGDTTRVSYTYY